MQERVQDILQKNSRLWPNSLHILHIMQDHTLEVQETGRSCMVMCTCIGAPGPTHLT